MRTALSIAGSDCSGGAGIQADLKTMTMNGVYAMSVITALTAQNTMGVKAIMEASPEFLKQQIDAVFEDIYPDAVKIGMVSSMELIQVIVDRLRYYEAKNVVVMPNSSKVKKQPYPETARLLGLEIFYKRIVSNSTKCPWYHICRKNQNLSEEERNSLNTDTTSYECLYDQWNKTQICLMTQTIKYYGLELKEFVQKA